MHDATRGSRLAGHSPTVCHHDPGPNNVVFRNGLPVAWIDFDTAAPGDPLEDVAYVAGLGASPPSKQHLYGSKPIRFVFSRMPTGSAPLSVGY